MTTTTQTSESIAQETKKPIKVSSEIGVFDASEQFFYGFGALPPRPNLFFFVCGHIRGRQPGIFWKVTQVGKEQVLLCGSCGRRHRDGAQVLFPHPQNIKQITEEVCEEIRQSISAGLYTYAMQVKRSCELQEKFATV
jgi:hypothetical protein